MAITEDTARRIYEGFLASQGGDGCTLEDVATASTQMTVKWRSHGTVQAAAEIVHKSCAPAQALVGPTLAISVPESLRASCPTTVQAAVAVIQRESFDVPMARSRGLHGWQAVALGGVGLATVLFIIAMVLRHRPITKAPLRS